MDTKKLRQKILDLAIRGKLVPQDPNDEPASVLLERIRAEKEQLIKEGKIKRTKKSLASDTSHYENVPFEVPGNWCWVSLSDVCNVARGGSPRPIKEYLTDDKNGINWIKIGDADKDGKYINSTKEKISPSGISKSRMVHKGDFLLTNSMSFGRPYILNIDGCIHDGWLVISPIPKTYDPEFLYYLLSSGFAYSQFTEAASGGVVSNLNSDKVGNSLFPLPPQSEQKRIVSELEKLFTAIRLIDNNKLLFRHNIEQIRSKILELAISGKLVHQNSSDEPAIELLKRINPAYKPADNRHYENVPTGWQFVKIKDVFTINPKNIVDDDIDAGFVSMAMIDDGYRDSYQFEKKKWALIKNGFTHFKDGDIAVAKISPCLENRKSMILKNLPNGIGAGTTELHIFRSAIVDPKFALYFFKSDHFINQCVGTFNGVVGQQRVGKNIIEDIMFPLPPYKEQRRISEKITQIFMCLDKITAEL